MSMPLAYDRGNAAKVLRLSVATLDRRVADGTIRAVKIGHRVVIPGQEINRILAGEPAPGGGAGDG